VHHSLTLHNSSFTVKNAVKQAAPRRPELSLLHCCRNGKKVKKESDMFNSNNKQE
jgi:hypothetical protein